MGAIEEELGRLRRGRGVMAGELGERVGPTLRALSGIDPAGSQDEVRRSLIAFLDDLAAGLPGDLKLAFSVALALHEDVQHRFLDERMGWLAARLHRDVRTARRRVDEAFKYAEASLGIARPVFDYVLGDWYLARFRALLLLDGAQPTAVEERTVVAARDNLAEIVISTSIPRAGPPGPHEHGAELSVLRGGELADSEWPTASYFRYAIRLPRPLRRGESHELGMSITIPRGQPFNPRYTFQPLRRCDEFDLRIRFGVPAMAGRVWRISGLPRGMVDDFADEEALVQPDTAGDIRLQYQHLRVGLAYGARWSSYQ